MSGRYVNFHIVLKIQVCVFSQVISRLFTHKFLVSNLSTKVKDYKLSY